ncbi:MAG: Gfo/Idh/MocA family oxidoreductase [Clostridia bacterium]|nr:Gfo/Idh/MocA family oxidoreductase [Clostridia bacterium]
MNTIRFGIFGAANIAHKFVDAVRLIDGAQVVTVASRSQERAEAFRARHGLPSVDTYESLVSRDDIDVIYIATTQNMHKENVLMCLRGGKHVICEKAMALSEADAREMFALAAEKNLFLMEAMWSRFLPNVQAAKKWLEEGRIGEIQSAYATIGFLCSQSVEGRIFNPALGGGAMYDIGVYAIEVLTYLMNDEIREIKSFVRPHAVTGVDERVSMLARFEKADALIDVSVSSNVKQFIILNGTKGRIEIPDFHVGNTAIFTPFDASAPETFTCAHPGDNGFVYEAKEVVSCIRDGRTRSDVVPPETTIECAKVFDLVLGKR